MKQGEANIHCILTFTRVDTKSINQFKKISSSIHISSRLLTGNTFPLMHWSMVTFSMCSSYCDPLILSVCHKFVVISAALVAC